MTSIFESKMVFGKCVGTGDRHEWEYDVIEGVAHLNCACCGVSICVRDDGLFWIEDVNGNDETVEYDSAGKIAWYFEKQEVDVK